MIACTTLNKDKARTFLWPKFWDSCHNLPAPDNILEAVPGREKERRRKLEELEKRAPSPLNFTQISESTNLSGPLCICRGIMKLCGIQSKGFNAETGIYTSSFPGLYHLQSFTEAGGLGDQVMCGYVR